LPFQATLKIIKECDGISKEEGFIVNTLKTMSDIDKTIKFIKEFRARLDKLRDRGKDAIRKYIIQQQRGIAKTLYRGEIQERLVYVKDYYKSKSHRKDRELLKKIVKGGKGSNTKEAIRVANELIDLKRRGAGLKELEDRFLAYYLILKSSSWRDYIDATARYFRMSGMLTIHRSRIKITGTHRGIAEWIISQDWQLKANGKYLAYLHDHTLPVLPHDKFDFLKRTTDEISKEVKELSEMTKVRVEPEVMKIDEKIADPLLLRKQLLRLTTIRRELKEYEYMLFLHHEKKAIDEIIKYFDSIWNNEILGYRPTHFEWNVWRGFLAIDKLSKLPHECRNFQIDDDLQPRSNAPGGRADMVFCYRDYTLVVEVTLSGGETQYIAEHESVPRHVVRVMEEERSREVYAIFIAPQIHINTAVHFYAKMISVPYYITSTGKRVYPKIVPLTLNEYIFLLRVFKEKRYTPYHLRQLLNKIVSLKDNKDIKDGGDWIKHIGEVIEEWAQKL